MKKLILLIVLMIAIVSAFGQTKTITKDTSKSDFVTTNTAFRVNYDYVFKRNTDGSYSTLFPVQVNGDMIGSGASFPPGTSFGGVDVTAYAGHDLMIDTVRRVVIIRKFLK
ncbi:MAG: hypothetical protein JST50_18525 [Bacteroidetes bacterium]|jgi:hypothetical protein|nr:hypothetical protein [Bacteroidota bacterium]